jgi:hypothetical protein
MALHGAIDDATGAGLALYLRPTEDLHGYVALLEHLCTRHGLPLAPYGDRLNIFVRNDRYWTLEEQLRGAQDPTHFGRIPRELSIGFIPAGERPDRTLLANPARSLKYFLWNGTPGWDDSTPRKGDPS